MERDAGGSGASSVDGSAAMTVASARAGRGGVASPADSEDTIVVRQDLSVPDCGVVAGDRAGGAPMRPLAPSGTVGDVPGAGGAGDGSASGGGASSGRSFAAGSSTAAPPSRPLPSSAGSPTAQVAGGGGLRGDASGRGAQGGEGEDGSGAENTHRDTCGTCKKGEEGETMLLCDRCPRAFHLQCLGMAAAPDADEWFCAHCSAFLAREAAREAERARAKQVVSLACEHTRHTTLPALCAPSSHTTAPPRPAARRGESQGRRRQGRKDCSKGLSRRGGTSVPCPRHLPRQCGAEAQGGGGRAGGGRASRGQEGGHRGGCGRRSGRPRRPWRTPRRYGCDGPRRAAPALPPCRSRFRGCGRGVLAWTRCGPLLSLGVLHFWCRCGAVRSAYNRPTCSAWRGATCGRHSLRLRFCAHGCVG
jgi:hypothetical protein